MLFLDLARVTGYCRGRAGTPPISGSIVLRKTGEPNGLAPGALGRWLRDHVRKFGKPDLIGIEAWMSPRAQKHVAIIEDSLRLNGAVHAIAGVYGIEITEPAAATVRKAVCGHANDPGETRVGGRMMKNSKLMVIRNVIMRGLLPADCLDDNRADAVAGWVYLEAMFARVPPATFSLTAK